MLAERYRRTAPDSVPLHPCLTERSRWTPLAFYPPSIAYPTPF
jgi:hypothetical protein